MKNEQRNSIAIRSQRVAVGGVPSGAHKLNNGRRLNRSCIYVHAHRAVVNTVATSPSQKPMRLTVVSPTATPLQFFEMRTRTRCARN